MKKESGKSKSGAPVFKYKERVEFTSQIKGDLTTPEVINKHLQRFFQEDEITVFHEIISDNIHVDIFLVKANKKRPYNILLTSGMSSLPMEIPKEVELDEKNEFAEVFLLLPPDWPLEEEAIQDENNYWPMRLLKEIARFPHLYKTWFSVGHTIPNGDPPKPYANNTEMCGVLLLPSAIMPSEFLEIKTPNKKIVLLSLMPLYKEEMDYKLRKGTDKLIDAFEKVFASPGDMEVLDVKRKNSCKRKFKLF